MASTTTTTAAAAEGATPQTIDDVLLLIHSAAEAGNGQQREHRQPHQLAYQPLDAEGSRAAADRRLVEALDELVKPPRPSPQPSNVSGSRRRAAGGGAGAGGGGGGGGGVTAAAVATAHVEAGEALLASREVVVVAANAATNAADHGASSSTAAPSSSSSGPAPAQTTLQDPLQLLHPRTHSIGYLYLLCARLGQARSAEELAPLDTYLSAWIASFDPVSVAHAGERLMRLVENAARATDQELWPRSTAEDLSAIVARLVSDPNTLTALHPRLLYRCLKERRYQEAYQQLLSRDLLHVGSEIVPLRHSDALEYFYYGGMIAARCGDQKRACQLFEMCLLCPARDLSAIQLDAYKKLILVQLWKDGKLYESTERDAAFKLTVFADTPANLEIFAKDCNARLVKTCMDLHLGRRIVRLGRVFERLKIIDVLQVLDLESSQEWLDEVQATIAALIQSGTLDAAYEPLPIGVLRFGGTHAANGHADLESIRRLEALSTKSAEWDQLLSLRERQLASSRVFLEAQAVAGGGAGRSRGGFFGGAGAGALSFGGLEGSGIIDEDIEDGE